jgi:hypothetical protein
MRGKSEWVDQAWEKLSFPPTYWMVFIEALSAGVMASSAYSRGP